jgi:phosphoesterase RecJ-like protein
MDWSKAVSLVQGANKILVVTHVSPDGDAIGSLLGLGNALKELGKTVMMSVDGGVPPSFKFLPGVEDITAYAKPSFKPDLFIAVDCGDAERSGKAGGVGFETKAPSINIDHHRTNTLFADANLVDLKTVAACEGVLDFLDHLNTPLTPTVAQCLLCGLVTDTLCFRTNNVTSETLGKAQRLMAAGADLSEIVQRTVNHLSGAALKLWKQVMPTVCLEDHVVWAIITLAARQQSGYADGADGGLVSLLIQADEAYISCVLREKEDNTVELSFRAVPGFDVSDYAVSVGGGGHSLASGATLKGSIVDIEAQVVPALKQIAQAGKPLYS